MTRGAARSHEWLDELRRRVADRPAYADGWCLLGDALLAEDCHLEAGRAYESALALNAGYRDAVLGLAFARARTTGFHAAFATFRRLFPLAAGDFMVPFALGVLCLREGWSGQGLDQLCRARELAPTVPFVALHLAGAWRAAGRDARAAQELDAARRLAGRSGMADEAVARLAIPETFDPPGHVTARIACSHWLAQRGVERGEVLDEIALRFPGHGRLLLEQGRSAALDGRVAAALAVFRAAMDVDVDCHDARFEAGLLTAEQGDLDAAVGLLQAAVTQRPTFPDYRYELALVLLEAGRAADAERELRLALTLEPGYGQCALRLAEVVAEQARMAEALEILDAGAWRDWPESWSLRAELLLGLQRVDEARAVVDRVLARDPEDLLGQELRSKLVAED